MTNSKLKFSVLQSRTWDCWQMVEVQDGVKTRH